MHKQIISLMQSLRDLPEKEKKEFPVRRKVSVTNAIQRLRNEGYRLKTETKFDEGIFIVEKHENPK